MILLSALNMLSASNETIEKNYEAIVDAAYGMLRARVVVTMHDYMLMTEIEKSALQDAGDKLSAEEAFTFGAAVLNKEFQRQLIGEAHGDEGLSEFKRGEALERLRQTVDEVKPK